MPSRRRVLVVVSERDDAEGFPGALVVTAQGYIEGSGETAEPQALVVNLCRTLGYGGDGYYVSLLADARGQQVLPRLETAAGVADPYARYRALQEAGIPTLDAAEMAVRRRSAGPAAGGEDRRDDVGGLGPLPLIRERDECRPARPDEVEELVACLGMTADARFHALAAGVFRVWPAPLLRIRVVREDAQWKVAGLAAVSPEVLTVEQRNLLVATVTGDMKALRRSSAATPRDAVRASVAVLLDPTDPFSASSAQTIERLERVAAGMNVHVARIGASDLRRLPEYDALFIRSLTGVKLPSFQFALRAEALDMPVIDDSQSIIRCSNKVFLEELLRREGVPLPRTRIVTTHTPWEQLAELGLPFVMKSPDGSFSSGVHKIGSVEEYQLRARELFRESPLLIAQEWLPTDFDWRITVLDGELLFAARYFMAQGHWQIRTEAGGVERYGKVEAVPRTEAPAHVVSVALRAARLIGRSMYGVDLKETADGAVVIEVNDNPNLDADYEDAADGDIIYEDIVNHFLRRIEEEVESTRRDSAPSAHGRPRQRQVGSTSSASASASATASTSRRGVPALVAKRPARGARPRPRTSPFGAFEVAGMELEYPTVNEELEVVALVEPAFRVIAGRGTSDIELERVGFSNEIADHVFEVKTLEPVYALRDAEEAIVGGIRRFSDVLQHEWRARLLPTAMHPWFDPMKARLWTRSGLRVYTTYAQIFDIRTHGWMNVHATHLNLPFGDERETMAMHTAAAMLLPYLPALAASSPVHDGVLQPFADARLAWILQHQSRIPETVGRIVPEYVDSFSSYRREIIQPMYAALDDYPHSEPIRQEFLNSRGAVLRFGRRALEIRVLDTQECVKLDVAIAVFTRAALRQLTAEVLSGAIEPPPHDALVADFEACVAAGSAAVVRAPHLVGDCGGEPCIGVRSVLDALMERARRAVTDEDAGYLGLVDDIIVQGTLSERIRARLEPLAGSGEPFMAGLREVYTELAACLVSNEPWSGRR
jgi:glutathione synthase/RimK-type ligase-like ATP-grasp enzyme/gamma-glutamyl:cysteine ligase YbdK (ATP-grasp superfamily)